MNKIDFIVGSPFVPIQVAEGSNAFEISSFSISRGRQMGKAMYCLEKSKDNSELVFQTCMWFRIFSLGITFFGLLFALSPVLLGGLTMKGNEALVICSMLFSLSGLFIFLNALKKSVFDLESKEVNFGTSPFKKGLAIKFSWIIGIQVIESFEMLSSSLGEYNVGKVKFYELNLVFENTE